MDADATLPTIMVVDDSPTNLTLLSEVLQDQGYRIVTFPSGMLALRAMDQHPPDLVLLDIMMPNMNGFEVCQAIKRNPYLAEIPVIFISALGDAADRVQAFAAGGVDYLVKPFQQGEVLARVKIHLRLRQMQQKLQQQNLYLEDLVRAQVQEISDSQLATILAVSKLAGYRDEETGWHIERTRVFCKLLAQTLHTNPCYAPILTDQFIENIYHAAPLHDIGKVGIPDAILLKPGKLTSDEFTMMTRHTVIGAETLERVLELYPNNAFIKMGIELTRSHHERWDGTGYPDHLAGEAIPLSARILAVADVYDALRSKRPYKEPFDHAKTCAIICESAGSHFDPAIVDAFVTIEAEFERISKHMQDH
ncbi:response regulator [Candidatus Chloroploca sp. M-50]|uniref:Response regulator n=1 Tax=Candidatus Chloroploca mongolica TaxID=2528176 RepID=A0ABS4DEG1_9CHLR|nr:response regulator [Candidatus Chloroploca mongolica]MBP1467842.1 response regulator [Candidatus Chloroploca mongolica]